MIYKTNHSSSVVKNDRFMTSALGFVEETLINAEIVKLLPKFLAPYVGGTLSRCLSSHKTFFTSLIPATEERVREHELKKLGHEFPQRVGGSAPRNPRIPSGNSQSNTGVTITDPN